MSRVQILSIEVDKVTVAQALERCLAFVDSGQPHMVVTPNAEITYNAAHDPLLAKVLNDADLVVADGVGIVLGSRIVGDPVPEKVAGVELATLLVAKLAERGGSIYLLGGRPEVVSEAARRLKERFPGLSRVGFHHGYYQPADEPAIITEIRSQAPQALFVALGSPKQELWISGHLPEIGVPVCMGVGGTVDVWAGVASRGPEWMRRVGLEWLYRSVKLGRIRRSIPPLMKFVLAVIGRRLRPRSH